jgi:dUTP pyrophosphatase
MEIKVMLDEGAYMPNKAHDIDAGFDLRTPMSVFVMGRDAVVIDTGVHMAIPEGYCGLLVSKSGLNVKNGITGTGLIDAGYTGSIIVKLYNDSYDDKVFDSGDKIIQIIILPVPDVKLVMVDSLEDTERGDNGFGSTGR